MGSEDLGAEKGESREVRIDETFGFEEVDGGENLVDGFGKRVLLRLSFGAYDAE